jgi:hypothetical protein
VEAASRGTGVSVDLVWFGSRFGLRNLLFLRKLRPLMLMTYDRPLLRLSSITARWSTGVVL